LLLHIIGAFAEFERALVCRTGADRCQGSQEARQTLAPRKVFRRGKVIEMPQAGNSWRVIAAALGVSVAPARDGCVKSLPEGLHCDVEKKAQPRLISGVP
jgi:hypothetical protein